MNSFILSTKTKKNQTTEFCSSNEGQISCYSDSSYTAVQDKPIPFYSRRTANKTQDSFLQKLANYFSPWNHKREINKHYCSYFYTIVLLFLFARRTEWKQRTAQ